MSENDEQILQDAKEKKWFSKLSYQGNLLFAYKVERQIFANMKKNPTLHSEI